MATAEATETFLTPTNIARSLQLDPSAPVRWLRKGVLRPDGSRLRLQHICVPGGYRVKQEWLDAFLQALADDRAGKPTEAPKRAASVGSSCSHARQFVRGRLRHGRIAKDGDHVNQVTFLQSSVTKGNQHDRITRRASNGAS